MTLAVRHYSIPNHLLSVNPKVQSKGIGSGPSRDSSNRKVKPLILLCIINSHQVPT